MLLDHLLACYESLRLLGVEVEVAAGLGIEESDLGIEAGPHLLQHALHALVAVDPSAKSLTWKILDFRKS